MNRRVAGLGCLAVLVASTATAEVAVLATSDDLDLDSFGQAHLLPGGGARFAARELSGDDVFVHIGAAGQAPTVLRRDGDSAPIAGATMVLSGPVFADDLSYVYRAGLQGEELGPEERQASFTSSGSVIQQSTHTAAPGIPDATLDFAALLRYQRGRLALISFLGGPGANCGETRGTCATAVFAGTPGGLAKVVRLGELVGGLEVGSIRTGPSDTVLLDNGRVAHIVGLRGAGVTPGVDDAVVLRDSTIVARRGDPAPGGGTFGYPSGIRGGPGGTFVFHSNHGLFDEGWFHHDGVLLRRVAHSGDPVPGGVLSSVGQAAVAGSTVVVVASPGSNEALYRWTVGGLEELWGSGDPAPGTSLTFDTFVPGIDEAGRIVFVASLSDGSAGVWAVDCVTHQAAELLLRTGDAIQVAPGDSRTVSTLQYQPDNGGSGWGRTLDAGGESLFRVTFSDASRAVVRVTPSTSCRVHSDSFESGDFGGWGG